jgi:hypothetical protein
MVQRIATQLQDALTSQRPSRLICHLCAHAACCFICDKVLRLCTRLIVVSGTSGGGGGGGGSSSSSHKNLEPLFAREKNLIEETGLNYFCSKGS